MPAEFEDGLYLYDQDATPVQDLELRVIDGRVICIDVSTGLEVKKIAATSVEGGPGSGLDADTLDGIEASGFATSTHAATHIQGGTDELDGDRVDVDVTLSNITPDVTPPEVTDVKHLGAILKGIDNALSALAGDTVVVQIHEGLHSTNSGTYTTVARMLIDFDRLPTTTPEFSWNQTEAPGAPGGSVRLRNVTDGSDLFEATGITTGGIKTETVTLPTGKKLCYLQHRDDGGSGRSRIEGGSLHVG